jgi:hypothetical protein
MVMLQIREATHLQIRIDKLLPQAIGTTDSTSKITAEANRNTWLSASQLRDREPRLHAGIAEDAR